jgi:hypothetical protein
MAWTVEMLTEKTPIGEIDLALKRARELKP